MADFARDNRVLLVTSSGVLVLRDRVARVVNVRRAVQADHSKADSDVLMASKASARGQIVLLNFQNPTSPLSGLCGLTNQRHVVWTRIRNLPTKSGEK
jgi:hypothetical protein